MRINRYLPRKSKRNLDPSVAPSTGTAPGKLVGGWGRSFMRDGKGNNGCGSNCNSNTNSAYNSLNSSSNGNGNGNGRYRLPGLIAGVRSFKRRSNGSNGNGNNCNNNTSNNGNDRMAHPGEEIDPPVVHSPLGLIHAPAANANNSNGGATTRPPTRMIAMEEPDWWSEMIGGESETTDSVFGGLPKISGDAGRRQETGPQGRHRPPSLSSAAFMGSLPKGGDSSDSQASRGSATGSVSQASASMMADGCDSKEDVGTEGGARNDDGGGFHDRNNNERPAAAAVQTRTRADSGDDGEDRTDRTGVADDRMGCTDDKSMSGVECRDGDIGADASADVRAGTSSRPSGKTSAWGGCIGLGGGDDDSLAGTSAGGTYDTRDDATLDTCDNTTNADSDADTGMSAQSSGKASAWGGWFGLYGGDEDSLAGNSADGTYDTRDDATLDTWDDSTQVTRDTTKDDESTFDVLSLGSIVNVEDDSFLSVVRDTTDLREPECMQGRKNMPPAGPIEKVESLKGMWENKLVPAAPSSSTMASKICAEKGDTGAFRGGASGLTSASDKTPVTRIAVAQIRRGNGRDGSRVKSRAPTPVTKITASPAKIDESGDGSSKLKPKTNIVVKGSVGPMLQNWGIDEQQRDIYCPKRGGTENMKIRQYSDIPKPKAPDHIVVKVLQSTVSSEDCLARTKGDLNTEPHTYVPGRCIVGRIHSIGVMIKPSKFRVGGRVTALLPDGGGNAKYASVPQKNTILLPEDANHNDIICLVSSYMTAYQCLKLSKKEGAPLTHANVLVVGGSGPVGQAIVELALQEGARVYATAHKMHGEHLARLGVEWLSIKSDEWLPRLRGRMDVVIDNLCIDGYESSYKALTPDGTLVCNTGNRSEHLIHQKKDLENGINTWWSDVKARYVWDRVVFYDVVESFDANPKMFSQELKYLVCKLQGGDISPKVAGMISLNQVPNAQALIERGLPNGTVVCLPWKKLDPRQKVKVERIWPRHDS